MTNISNISDPRANMLDEQTMPGFEPPAEGEQETYLPPIVPEGYITPPSGTQFANATWLRAGPEIERLVRDVLDFEEFNDIRELDYAVVWRRKAAPMRRDGPIFAGVEIVPQRIVWESYQLGMERFPRFFVDLYWQHFDDLRRGREPGSREKVSDERAAANVSYVHGGILQQHLHHALSTLEAESDILKRRQPDFAGFAATIQRFGQWTSGVMSIARQLELWPKRGEG